MAGARQSGGGEVHAYTDGGASPNPGPGGWGVVLLRPGGKHRELSGGEDFTTNNRMELTAAIRALEAAGEHASLRVVTDSQYLRRGITQWLPRWAAGGWRRRDGGEVANQDLWRRLAALAGSRKVRWEWVRGHAGHRWNERADALARAAAASRRRGAGEGGGAAAGAGAAPMAAGGVAARAGAAPAVAAGVAPDFDVYLKASGRGGWAARVRPRDAGGGGLASNQRSGGGGAADASRRSSGAGAGSRGSDAGADGGGELLTGASHGASANELILHAAAEALESLPRGSSTAIHTGSDYLRDGAARWLGVWRRRGWRTQAGGAVANRDAWERLSRALAAHRVSWPRPTEAAAAEIAALDKPAREAAGKR